MKVFKVYFLALLLIFMVPLLALAEEKAAEEGGSEDAVSQEAAESTEEVKKEDAEKKDEKPADEENAEAEKSAEVQPAQMEPTEVKPAEVKPAEEKTAEMKPAEPQADEPKVTAKVESEGEGEADKKDDKEKSDKKFSVSVTNGFSHGLSKERKSFGYNLNLGASYSFPWKMVFAADVGLNAGYRYDMDSAVAPETGETSDGKIDSGKFDGTPLNLGLSMPFPLFWEIDGVAGINVGLPFTSTELWEQYQVYMMLTVNLGLNRSFKIAKETSLGIGFNFDYTKTFSKEGYAWDDLSNEVLDIVTEHNFGLNLGLSLSYKSASLKLGGGYIIARNYKMSYTEDTDWTSSVSDQEWYYLFTFGASLSYSYKDWNFAIGARTNASEYDNGNYSGFNTVAGDPTVKNGSANYPFKPKYTVVFANIGYSYSF